MKNSKLLLFSLTHALGVAVYIIGVSFIMRNAEKIFGKMDNFFGPVAFLLLFVLSAAVTGALTLGRPVLLYMDNHRAEAIKMFFYTVGWLFVIMLLVFLGYF